MIVFLHPFSLLYLHVSFFFFNFFNRINYFLIHNVVELKIIINKSVKIFVSKNHLVNNEIYFFFLGVNLVHVPTPMPFSCLTFPYNEYVDSCYAQAIRLVRIIFIGYSNFSKDLQ